MAGVDSEFREFPGSGEPADEGEQAALPFGYDFSDDINDDVAAAAERSSPQAIIDEYAGAAPSITEFSASHDDEIAAIDGDLQDPDEMLGEVNCVARVSVASDFFDGFIDDIDLTVDLPEPHPEVTGNHSADVPGISLAGLAGNSAAEAEKTDDGARTAPESERPAAQERLSTPSANAEVPRQTFRPSEEDENELATAGPLHDQPDAGPPFPARNPGTMGVQPGALAVGRAGLRPLAGPHRRKERVNRAVEQIPQLTPHEI